MDPDPPTIEFQDEHPTKGILSGGRRESCRQPGPAPPRELIKYRIDFYEVGIDTLEILLEALDRILWLGTDERKCHNSVFVYEITPDGDIIRQCTDNLTTYTSGAWRGAFEQASKGVDDTHVNATLAADVNDMLRHAFTDPGFEKRIGSRRQLMRALRLARERIFAQVDRVQRILMEVKFHVREAADTVEFEMVDG